MKKISKKIDDTVIGMATTTSVENKKPKLHQQILAAYLDVALTKFYGGNTVFYEVRSAHQECFLTYEPQSALSSYLVAVMKQLHEICEIPEFTFYLDDAYEQLGADINKIANEFTASFPLND